MAFLSSNKSNAALIVSDYTAYELGKKGIKITSQFLSNYLNTFNTHALEVKRSILQRRIKGFGATLQHLLAVVLGLLVFATALVVDYNIIHEFWVRVLSNEFMEVPDALSMSVVMKSLQVLFATLSIHYLFSHIGHKGRVAYVVFVFILTASMIGGVGLLYAQSSMPTETTATSETIQKFAEKLGVDAPKVTVTEESASAAVSQYKEYIWLSALSVLFFIVASIGALSLHTATQGFASLTGGAFYDTNRETNRNNRFRDELAQVERDLIHLKTDGEEQFIRGKVADFQSSYSIGLIDGRHSQVTCEQLLNFLEEAIQNIKA